MSCIVFLFGASCSGKSTLGEALQGSLGDDWTYIDRDYLIEENLCSDATADKALEDRIQAIKHKIIIDAQIPWREKREGELYFMIFPPLEVLLKRDANRTRHLQRSEAQSYYARKYVLETYNALQLIDKKYFNQCFDSSQDSVEEEICMIKLLIKSQKSSFDTNEK